MEQDDKKKAHEEWLARVSREANHLLELNLMSRLIQYSMKDPVESQAPKRVRKKSGKSKP